MNPKDIQSFLGLSKNSTYNLIESGMFHSIKVGILYKILKVVLQNGLVWDGL